MFNCQKCKKTQPARVKQEKITVESRPVSYFRNVFDPETGVEIPVMIAQGSEIMKEISVCEKCKTESLSQN